MLSNGTELQFLEGITLCMHQNKKVGCLDTQLTEEKFRCQGALTKYIAMNDRPDMCNTIQLVASGYMLIR